MTKIKPLRSNDRLVDQSRKIENIIVGNKDLFI